MGNNLVFFAKILKEKSIPTSINQLYKDALKESELVLLISTICVVFNISTVIYNVI
jgi:hypothetical protein